jgi:hypothetical protein
MFLILLNNNNKFSLDMQGIPNELYVNFLQLTYNSVIEGFKASSKVFKEDPGQFDFRTAKAVYLNSNIKKIFYLIFKFDIKLNKKVNHLKSHGVDYYMLDGKV